ncbi:MAG: hypothetical protein AAF604_21045 [Acidobacteriota bacterium]
MELRQPPTTARRPTADPMARHLLWLQTALLVLLIALFGWHLASDQGNRQDDRRDREVAAKLKAAGVVDEAARLYESYLTDASAPAAGRAEIAYSLGTTYLEHGRYESALRWFYEAEALGSGELGDQVAEKIVHALERLGRVHAAHSALAARTRLDGDDTVRAEDDPVLAELGERTLRRSDLDATLATLPPQAAAQLAAPEQRAELLRKLVSDELILAKARKLEIDDDPQVRRQIEEISKQAVIARFLELEVMAKITVDDADLENFYRANVERYRPPAKDGEEAPAALPLDQIRSRVEQEYRLQKAQSTYAEMVEEQLSAADVKLYPERLDNGG